MHTGRVLLLSALTAALTSAATFFLLQRFARPGDDGAVEERLVEVPPLTGLQPDQARKLLEPRGLSLVVSEGREDPRALAGQILQQSPLEGSKVKRGSEVRAVLSTGQAKVEVPALAKLPLASATQLCAGAGLRVGAIARERAAGAPPDQVISSRPAAGVRVARGSAVDLTVAASAEEQKVPSLLGKTPAQASAILERSGLKLGKQTYGSDEDRRGGVIIRQTPVADTSAPRGSAVNVVVNESD
jgi:serine/threonine-protein kinase